MKSLRLEKDKIIEESIIKDVRNLFRLKKEMNGNAIKDIRNLFRPKKENKAIKDWKLGILGTFLSTKKKIIINQ